MLFDAGARSGQGQPPQTLYLRPRPSPIVVTLQPRVDLRDGSLCAMQVAGRQTSVRLRDQHDEAADQLLDQALSWAAQAQALGQPIPVAIELSTEQLRCATLPGRVEQALQHHALRPALLEISLPEAALDEDSLAQATRLRRLGLSLALGPVATEIDAPVALQRLPISGLKLSQGLVAGLTSNPRLAAWLQSLLPLTRQLGLRCIADGIASPEQLALLRRLGCAEGLGFLLALPMSPVQALALLHRSPPWQPLLVPHSRSLTL